MPAEQALAATIEPLAEADYVAVRAIHLEGIATGDATLEPDAPTWAEFHAGHLAAGRLVARDAAGIVVGWAALTPVSGRCVYAGVAEVSVYVAEAVRGRGIGRVLLAALRDAAEADGLWTLQAHVVAENVASRRLHVAAGFREVGVREGLGQDPQGRWRDIVLLEWRSERVGRDGTAAG
jgi:phosphinothricin acetyltransferase